jgi:hypothetical protein
MNNELRMVLKELNKIDIQLSKSIDKAKAKDNLKVARIFSKLQNYLCEFENFAGVELGEDRKN